MIDLLIAVAVIGGAILGARGSSLWMIVIVGCVLYVGFWLHNPRFNCGVFDSSPRFIAETFAFLIMPDTHPAKG